MKQNRVESFESLFEHDDKIGDPTTARAVADELYYIQQHARTQIWDKKFALGILQYICKRQSDYLNATEHSEEKLNEFNGKFHTKFFAKCGHKMLEKERDYSKEEFLELTSYLMTLDAQLYVNDLKPNVALATNFVDRFKKLVEQELEPQDLADVMTVFDYVGQYTDFGHFNFDKLELASMQAGQKSYRDAFNYLCQNNECPQLYKNLFIAGLEKSEFIMELSAEQLKKVLELGLSQGVKLSRTTCQLLRDRIDDFSIEQKREISEELEKFSEGMIADKELVATLKTSICAHEAAKDILQSDFEARATNPSICSMLNSFSNSAVNVAYQNGASAYRVHQHIGIETKHNNQNYFLKFVNIFEDKETWARTAGYCTSQQIGSFAEK